MTDEELKKYEVTLHASNKENLNFMKAFAQDLEDMYKRQLELAKEITKKGFEK
jgi:plasmid replication initiation protein